MKRKLYNGVEMPQEGFGVFQVPESVCREVVLSAIRIGYRLIDTASSYQNEEAVGAAIREAIAEGSVKREELFIATKAYIQEMGYENLKEAFARSLDKLGLAYLDLYLIHMPLGDYYGAWRAMEELYREGKIRAIGVCNFDAARLMDLCYNAEIKPMVNQIERHPHYQRHEELAVMKKLGVQPQGWAPFAEGLKGMFTEPVLQKIAEKHGKTVAQVILRWNIQQGVVIIPKSVHKERMEENLAIWDFVLDADDMEQIAALDKKCPSMLDCSRPSEIDRLYDYLNNPVLTTLSSGKEGNGMILNIEVNHTDLQVELLPGSSSEALAKLLKDGPITLPMKDYAHMEKFGDLGVRLPRNDQHITTKAGDVILSEGRLLVIYYAPNTWNFTRLGRVVNMDENHLKKVLGKGNIMATLTLPAEENRA